MNLHIDQLIMYKGGDKDFKYGLSRAYYNHINGRPTTSEGEAVTVRWINEERKYLVIDGYHRIVKAMLEGKETIRCKIDWFGSKEWWLPPKKYRFSMKQYLTEGKKYVLG